MPLLRGFAGLLTIRARSIACVVLVFSVCVSIAGEADAAVGNPAADGRWEELEDWPLVPIHMSLDAGGRVVSYGSVPGNRNAQGALHYDVWSERSGHSTPRSSVTTDFFCGIQNQDPYSDRLISFGGDQTLNGGPGGAGTKGFSSNAGNRDIVAYSASNPSKLVQLPGMSRARWYGSSVVLPNGQIYVQGGSADGGTYQPIFGDIFDWVDQDYAAQRARRVKRTVFGSLLEEETNPASPQFHPEVWENGEGARLMTELDTSDIYWYYPRLFVLSDGRVGGIDTRGFVFTINKEMDAVALHLNLGSDFNSNQGPLLGGKMPAGPANGLSAVHYRQDQILVFGPTNTSVTVDFSGATPTVSPAGKLSGPRQWGNATILPDGRVLATGGARIDSSSYTGGSVWGNGHIDQYGTATTAEVWDPATRSWTTYAGGLDKARLYHSTALLLPTGKVLVGGGGTPGPIINSNVEIYTPGYLLRGDGSLRPRPTASILQRSAKPGEEVTVSVSDDTTRLTMVKYGMVTHSNNMEQRFIPLNARRVGRDMVATLPQGTMVTPGNYHVFALNAQGTPSTSVRLRITPSANLDAINAGSCKVRAPANAFRNAVDTSPASAQVWRLYQAFVLRQPDEAGFNYWLRQRQAGTRHVDIANSFASSQEFQNRYGDFTNAKFVDLIYRNLLCRAPDTAGRNYWVDQLDAGRITRGEATLWISEGTEYMAKTGTRFPYVGS